MDTTQSNGKQGDLMPPSTPMLPCPETWRGPLHDFIMEYTFNNWFTVDGALRLHEQLLLWVKYGKEFFTRNLTGGSGPRGTRVDGFPAPYRMYSCDNAPAMWVYSVLALRDHVELGSAIQQRLIPLRERFGNRPGEDGYEWGDANPDPVNFRGAWGGGMRWKLCHLYSVSDGMPSDLEGQKRRFVRLLHPFNMFLFPRPIRKGAGYYPVSHDLGEDVSVCGEMARMVQWAFGSARWQEFLEAAGIRDDETPGRINVLSSANELVLNFQFRSRVVRADNAEAKEKVQHAPEQAPSVSTGDVAGTMVETIRNRAGTLLVVADDEADARLCIFPGGETRLLDEAQLDPDSEREIALEEADISGPQKLTYARLAREADLQRLLCGIDKWRSPSRPFLEGGGAFLAHLKGATLPFVDLFARLKEWLQSSRESTIGGGNVGVQNFFFAELDGIRFGVHADVGVTGVAEFLKFVARAGGPEKVRIVVEHLGQPGSVSFGGMGVRPECPDGFYTSYCF